VKFEVKFVCGCKVTGLGALSYVVDFCINGQEAVRFVADYSVKEASSEKMRIGFYCNCA